MHSLELFSGAGGLAKGLEMAGFEHRAFVEHNRHACASLRTNFTAHRVFQGDVWDFDLASLGTVDIVAGGPPCQPFSLGGKHQAEADERDMFPAAMRAIEQLAPRAFIFENVKGLLRPSFATYFQYILLRLAYPEHRVSVHQPWQEHLAQLQRLRPQHGTGLHYKVHHQLLNAADYGVPQLRERVFIVGIRADIGQDWAFPLPTHSEDRLLWEQHISGDYWQRHNVPPQARPETPASVLEKTQRLQARYGLFEPAHRPWKTIRDALHDLPDPRHPHPWADHTLREGARSYPGHTGSDYDWPAKTIKAGGHGVPGGENMIRYSDGSLRYFTVREAKRIQAFPDDFVIQGAWGEAMRQIGNAVPVTLGHILGQQLRQLLSSHAATSSRPEPLTA
jgi:DNA (cytosine-5)-methyltransferase 1